MVNTIRDKFRKVASVDHLHEKSKGILDVFTVTLRDLGDVNTEIDGHIESREQEIARIQSEHTRLHGIKTANQVVIDKINKIFE